MGATFDGASVNRKLLQQHSKDNSFVHKVLNPISSDARQFFFFFDPPHLIKTTRNCWASQARTLWVSSKHLHQEIICVCLFIQNNGKEIKWGHLWSLYYRNRTSTGMTFVGKLKWEHIKLNSFSKMRVDLAAEVQFVHELLVPNN